MFLEIFTFFWSIGAVLCVYCSKYNSFTFSIYYTYCSGYCSGIYGSQYCYYYYYYYSYVISGGAIAGIVIGVLFSVAVVIVFVIICVRAQNRRRTTGAVIGPSARNTHVAVTNTTYTTAHMQPANNFGYQTMPPPSYNAVYPPPSYPPQSHQGYPPPGQPPQGYAPPSQPPQGYSSPAQPQYTPMYNQPGLYNTMPQTNI